MKNKIIALILTIITILSCVSVANAGGSAEAELYAVYGDGMLLQQNKRSHISGTATPGAQITLELFYNGFMIFDSSATASADGTFSVAVDAPLGSFEEYTITLKVNGKVFEQLDNILFGELWLANGQSNMQYPLSQEKQGEEMFLENRKLSKYLRVLYIPDIPEYKGVRGKIPVEPQRDIPGAKWINGEDGYIYNMSAVAYYFSQAMCKNLNVPVGIINVPLGGSTIAAWLSREVIESNNDVKNALISHGRYIAKSEWNEDAASAYHDMTSTYNLKMEGIKDFSISGMIWYQGETDVIFGMTDKEYADAFNLLQESYTKLFSYDDGLLPIVYTQLAAYYYSEKNTDFLNRNISFSDMQQQKADSRAVVSIYDIALTYKDEVGAIHPECKKEIGERMAFAAQGLVYNQRKTYTAATVKEAIIKESSVYVSLKNTGDGLKAKGGQLNGFAICGADGIYVKANAEIVSADTVRVWNEDIKNPASVSYAYYTNNLNANLYATENGEFALPVSSFITDKKEGIHHWVDKQWADCDLSEVWRIEGDTYSGMYSTWQADDADISFADGTINVKKDSALCRFSVSPLLTYKDGILKKPFSDEDRDYSDYGTMSFMVKNNADTAVKLKGVRFYVNGASWYAPAVMGTKSPQTVIPADGQWHKITLDLDTLYLSGNEGGAAYSNEKIDDVKNIKFVFSTEIGKDADVSLDNITFTPLAEDSPTRFEPDIKNADNILEIISALVINVIGLIVRLFS